LSYTPIKLTIPKPPVSVSIGVALGMTALRTLLARDKHGRAILTDGNAVASEGLIQGVLDSETRHHLDFALGALHRERILEFHVSVKE